MKPVDFFRGIRRRGDFINPLIFAIVCYEVSVIIASIADAIFLDEGLEGLVGSIIAIIFAPIIGAIALFIGAAILHLLVMLIVGSRNAGLEATFRVAAYVGVIQLVAGLAAMPILGIFVSIAVTLYAIFLGVVGIREVHTTTTGKAALVVLIPGAVVVLVLGASAFVIFGQR